MPNYQAGSLTFPPHDDPLDLNVEVSYAGIWRQLNDHVNYLVGTEGFGQTSQTFRRIEVTSSFYAGNYTVNNVPESTKRPLQFWVKGSTYEELANARDDLIKWFTQDDFIVRITRNETLEYWECECADYQIDESHVFLHNKMCKVNFTTTVMPYVSTYVVF